MWDSAVMGLEYASSWSANVQYRTPWVFIHLCHHVDCHFVYFQLEHETGVEECKVARDTLLDLGRAHRAAALSSDQIDADGFRFSGLRVDTNFEADGLIPGDLIALAQIRDVEENVGASVVRFDEAKSLVLVEHLDFAGGHGCPSISSDLNSFATNPSTE
jgi:hypothetical protein